MFEIGDTVKVIAQMKSSTSPGRENPDMYETQVGMEAGAKSFHKGCELELVPEGSPAKAGTSVVPSRGIMD